MNSRELLSRAMRLQTPVRVPLMASPSWGFVLVQNPVIDPVDLWHNHHNSYPEAFCNVTKRFHFDGVKIPGAGLLPLNHGNIAGICNESNEGTVITFTDGDSCTFLRDELPRYHFKVIPETDIDELDPDTIPEKIKYHPVSTRLRMYLQESPVGRINEIRAAQKIMGPEISVHGQFYSPEDYLIDLVGLEGAMMAFLTHPEKCKEILLRFARAISFHVQELIDAGVDAVCASAPYAGQNFISMETYERIIAPAQKIIVDACISGNVPCYCHTCGSIDDRLESIIDVGFNGLECLDPPPLGNVSLEEAVKRIGNRAFIKGNIDPVNVLLKGTAGQIRKEVRKCLETGMKARGFILSTACTISPHTPPENVDILYEMVQEHGNY